MISREHGEVGERTAREELQPAQHAAGLRRLVAKLLDGVDVDARRGRTTRSGRSPSSASVNRILFRRSATLNMFRKLDSTAISPLQARHPAGRKAAVWVVSLARPAGGMQSSGVHRLANWLPFAGGRRSPHGLGSTSMLPPAAVMAASALLEKAWAFTVRARQLAAAEDLDQRSPCRSAPWRGAPRASPRRGPRPRGCRG